MFETLGLDKVSESIYRLILGQPSWGVAEIVEHLGLPETTVRDALDHLASLKLLWLSPDVPGVCRVVNPHVGLGALLARREAALTEQLQQIEVTRAAVTSLANQYSAEPDEPEFVERLEGIDLVRQRLVELAAATRKECLSFLPGGAQSADAMAASRPLDQYALQRGVAVRSVYQDSFRNDPATFRYVGWLASLGGEIRTVPTLPMPLVIVDRVRALIPLDPEDVRQGALLLSGMNMVAAVCVVFDQFWRVAVRWDTDAGRDESGLSPQEHELLWLLGQGLTDQVAARRLGVSLRTVRRMASELMARLHAHSRFEAGLRAGQRGWILRLQISPDADSRTRKHARGPVTTIQTVRWTTFLVGFRPLYIRAQWHADARVISQGYYGHCTGRFSVHEPSLLMVADSRCSLRKPIPTFCRPPNWHLPGPSAARTAA